MNTKIIEYKILDARQKCYNICNTDNYESIKSIIDVLEEIVNELKTSKD